MTDIAELLDSLAPRHEGTGDWDRVLRDAGVERRPLRLPPPGGPAGRVAAVAAAIALVALWPSGGPGPTVLERALAAVGNGQVLHFVYESDPPKTLVDLATGERTEVRAEHEVWFDPEAGVRETERFQGVVQFDTSLAPDEISEHAAPSTRAWAPATARPSSPAGRRSWARTWSRERRLLDPERAEQPRRCRLPGDLRAGLHPHRAARGDGADPHRLLRDARGRFGAARRAPSSESTAGGGDYGAAVELADAGALIGGEPVWAGADLHGFPLESVRELRLPTAEGEVTGLSLVYGTPESGPHVEISQATAPSTGLTMLAGVAGYVPPEGTALVAGSMVLLRSNRIVVAVHAPDEAMALDVARSLQPYAG